MHACGSGGRAVSPSSERSQAARGGPILHDRKSANLYVYEPWPKAAVK